MLFTVVRNFSWFLEVLEMFRTWKNMDQFISELGISPVGSGLQLKSRDEELIYWGSVVGLHTWNKEKKIGKLEYMLKTATYRQNIFKRLTQTNFNFFIY